MDAAHVMTLDVTCVDEDTPISMAWEVMQQLRVHHLPVVEHGRLVGIVSDRDLLERVTRGLDGRLSFPELCAAEVMSFEPLSCSPDTEVPEVAQLMLDRHIDAMPVVSAQGALIGIVTATDLLRLLARRAEVTERPLSSTGTYR